MSPDVFRRPRKARGSVGAIVRSGPRRGSFQGARRHKDYSTRPRRATACAVASEKCGNRKLRAASRAVHVRSEDAKSPIRPMHDSHR